MIYPAFLIGACAVLMVVFMTFMVPQIMDLMGKNGQQLPAATQLLISFNHFMGQWWWVILIAIVAAVLTFRGYIPVRPAASGGMRRGSSCRFSGRSCRCASTLSFRQSLGNLITTACPC
jgi:type II secretory pathway component PulF